MTNVYIQNKICYPFQSANANPVGACVHLKRKYLQSSPLPPAAIHRHSIQHASRPMQPYNDHSFPKASCLRFSNLQLNKKVIDYFE